MRSWKRFPVLIAVLATLLLSFPLSSLAASGVTNGDFETGDFTGWMVYNQPGSSGDWYVYQGTSSPLTGFSIAAPPHGTYAATTDQEDPGSHILYQDLTLDPGINQTLSLDVYYQNLSGSFATPATLDKNVFPNQQYRIDILNPSAPVDSVAPSDILGTVFQTHVGDPLTLAPTTKTFDLSPYAGTTVRLRLAEVDNQGPFLASVDNVQLLTGPPTNYDQCHNGGWQQFNNPAFRSQADCVRYVLIHRINRR